MAEVKIEENCHSSYWFVNTNHAFRKDGQTLTDKIRALKRSGAINIKIIDTTLSTSPAGRFATSVYTKNCAVIQYEI